MDKSKPHPRLTCCLKKLGVAANLCFWFFVRCLPINISVSHSLSHSLYIHVHRPTLHKHVHVGVMLVRYTMTGRNRGTSSQHLCLYLCVSCRLIFTWLTCIVCNVVCLSYRYVVYGASHWLPYPQVTWGQVIHTNTGCKQLRTLTATTFSDQCRGRYPAVSQDRDLYYCDSLHNTAGTMDMSI